MKMLSGVNEISKVSCRLNLYVCIVNDVLVQKNRSHVYVSLMKGEIIIFQWLCKLEMNFFSCQIVCCNANSLFF
jgi:hypothetical protein